MHMVMEGWFYADFVHGLGLFIVIEHSGLMNNRNEQVYLRGSLLAEGSSP